tara:strand:- start:2132 stop:2647 length:516 start_codon:yes stop_codon:yes gene_type:complete
MIKKIDISSSKSINQIVYRIKPISTLLKFITHTSSGRMYPLYTMAIPFILESGFEIVRIGVIAFAFQVPIYLLSKNLIKRERPSPSDEISPIITPPDKYSFPSGHCASSTLFTLIINQYMPWLTIYFIIWAIIIFISRVGLGIHYLSDCIFGVVLGFISFLIANQLLSIFF